MKKGEYAIKVPEGTADKVREGLAEAAPGQLNAMQLHTVKRGETLATIARKLQVNRTDLAEANYCRTTSRVAVGARLIIPRMPSAALLARASAGELEKAAETIAADVLAETTEAAERDGRRRAARDLSRAAPATRSSAIARKTRHDHHAVEELEQAADDEPEDRHAAPHPVAARRQLTAIRPRPLGAQRLFFAAGRYSPAADLMPCSMRSATSRSRCSARSVFCASCTMKSSRAIFSPT